MTAVAPEQTAVHRLQAAAYALAEAIEMVAQDATTQDQLEDVIEAVRDAGAALVGATERELAAQSRQSEEKDRLIESLIGTNHPQTGKVFSLSSAEEFAKSLPEYRLVVAGTHRAAVEKLEAEHALTVAKLRARVAIARLERAS